MTTRTIYIPSISCGHCVATIKRELIAIEGVTSIDGDPQKKEIVVQWDEPATGNIIADALTDIGYPPAKK